MLVDSLFFVLSKVVWLIVAPDALLVLGLVGTTVLLLRGHVRFAKSALVGLTIFVLAIAVLPLGSWGLLPLERRFERSPALPTRIDGILVLSGGVNARATVLLDQLQVNEQADRDFALVALSRRYPEAQLVYSGGSSSLADQQFKGADAGVRFLTELGVDLGRVIMERDSRNTAESARFAMNKIQPKVGENWVLVTSAFHMPRSIGVFCQEGWKMIPYPVDFKSDDKVRWSFDVAFASNLDRLSLAVKEWVGLLAYKLSGRIPELLPREC